jgi:hypothetical protein
LQGGTTTLGATSAASLDAGTGTIETSGSLKGGMTTLGATSAASLDAGTGTIETSGSLKGGTTTLGATIVTSLDAGTGTIETSGSLKGGTTTLGATIVTSLDAGTGTIETSGSLKGGTTTLGATIVTSLDAGTGTIETSGALKGGITTLGATSAASLDAGTGTIETSGELKGGITTLGATSVTSLSAGTGTIETSGALKGGITTLGATSVTSLSAGTGKIETSGALKSGITTLGATSVTSLSAGTGKIETSGALSAGLATLNGLTVKDGDITVYRQGGTSGVVYLHNGTSRYLFWSGTRYIMPGAPLRVDSLDAGSGSVVTTGSAQAGSLAVSGAAQAGSLAVSGAAQAGSLAVSGATSLSMTNITGTTTRTSHAANTDLLVKGDAINIIGAHREASGLWGSYERGVDGGDLILTAGDGVSVGNNGSTASSIYGGDVYVRAGRAWATGGTQGSSAIRTYAGAIFFQSGSLEQNGNKDGNTYVNEMTIQDGKVGIGVQDVSALAESLQVSGSVAVSDNMIAKTVEATNTLKGGTTTLGATNATSLNTVAGTIETTGELKGGTTTLGATKAKSLDAGAGTIETTGTLKGGSTTLKNTTVEGSMSTTGDLEFTSYNAKIGFTGITDRATIQYLKDDDSSANPWADTNSDQNSALVIAVGDDNDATHGDSIRLDASRGIVLQANDRVITTCQIEARGGLNALDKTIVTSGALQAGAASTSSLDARSGTIKTTGSVASGSLSVTGDVRTGQVHIRSYTNLVLGAATDSYAEICSVETTHGARIVHIDLVQSTADGSHSMTYVLAEQHALTNSNWECLPVATSGAWGQDRIALEVNTSGDKSTFSMKRISGTHTDNIVAIVKVASNTVPAITKLTGTGTRAAYTNLHPCAQLTQINGNIGVGIRDPTAKLHVQGQAILGETNVTTLNAGSGAIETTGALKCGSLEVQGGIQIDNTVTRFIEFEVSLITLSYTDIVAVKVDNHAIFSIDLFSGSYPQSSFRTQPRVQRFMISVQPVETETTYQPLACSASEGEAWADNIYLYLTVKVDGTCTFWARRGSTRKVTQFQLSIKISSPMSSPVIDILRTQGALPDYPNVETHPSTLIQQSRGMVGINTSEPNSTLDVEGTFLASMGATSYRKSFYVSTPGSRGVEPYTFLLPKGTIGKLSVSIQEVNGSVWAASADMIISARDDLRAHMTNIVKFQSGQTDASLEPYGGANSTGVQSPADEGQAQVSVFNISVPDFSSTKLRLSYLIYHRFDIPLQ